MSYTVFAVVAALVLLWHSSVAVDDCKNSLGNRKPSVLADDIYEALVNLAEGKSLPPVKERTKAIRTATVRYWRAKGKISVKDKISSYVEIFRGKQNCRRRI